MGAVTGAPPALAPLHGISTKHSQVPLTTEPVIAALQFVLYSGNSSTVAALQWQLYSLAPQLQLYSIYSCRRRTSHVGLAGADSGSCDARFQRQPKREGGREREREESS